ncbi:hypothetical protein Q673_11250 [Marinobacter sp. EN3]|jgi:hypothetical protein|uniref:hypothetical protein n=1 Tax=unclassified Marinobacter TaxID=83889 RepID=UPI0003B8C128|nr:MULTISPECIES: hypothetical protein [unclassified Marinobacter]ERS11304.1 hypothetical protein Q673_11250 [Marinobacter sp. EN3]MDX5385802.1 hypothetical protein [Marinobacter sp.]MDX5440047.1 hypothetical protein [Alteromonadaceae bacterium]
MQTVAKPDEQNRRKAVVLTDEMIQYAEELKSDKQRARAFLKKAGLLNKKGKLAKEYAA